MGDIVAVCTRYYGGVKLGTGGLSRAYSGGVKRCLEALPTSEKIDRIRLRVVLAYSEVDAFRRLADEAEAIVEDETFATSVSFVVGVPSTERAAFEAVVASLTQGRARVEGA